MTNVRHEIQVLNALLPALLDSAERLDHAAKESQSSGHGAVFGALARERRDLGEAIGATIRALGGTPHESGSFLAKAQRAMMDMSHALLPDEAGLVGTADRGEAALDRKFEVALADERLSAATRDMLMRAHAFIHRETHEVHDLRISLEGQRDLTAGLYPQ